MKTCSMKSMKYCYILGIQGVFLLESGDTPYFISEKGVYLCELLYYIACN